MMLNVAEGRIRQTLGAANSRASTHDCLQRASGMHYYSLFDASKSGAKQTSGPVERRSSRPCSVWVPGAPWTVELPVGGATDNMISGERRGKDTDANEVLLPDGSRGAVDWLHT
jgi:hypothetical protein